jgi:hypothetical protein
MTTLTGRALHSEAYEASDEIVVIVHVGDLENTRLGRAHAIVSNGALELHIPYQEELRRVPLQRSFLHAETAAC